MPELQQKLVDDLLDQITGGDRSRMLFRLRQVGASRECARAGSVCEVAWSYSSPQVGCLPGKPKRAALRQMYRFSVLLDLPLFISYHLPSS